MEIDKIIQTKFTSSFMNDSKWYRLIEVLTDSVGEVFVNYKLIHEEVIYFTSFDSPDCKPFFREPIFYKEVEWIEFPSTYVMNHNKRTTRKFIKYYNQDVGSIEKIINDLGKFMLERHDRNLRIVAYR